MAPGPPVPPATTSARALRSPVSTYDALHDSHLRPHRAAGTHPDRGMSELVLADVVMDHLRKRYPCYHDTAYLFILSGLHYTIERLGEARHITGRELTEGCRDLAIDRYGPMAKSVLEFWGIRSTRDLGEIDRKSTRLNSSHANISYA